MTAAVRLVMAAVRLVMAAAVGVAARARARMHTWARAPAKARQTGGGRRYTGT